jgi:Trypsin-like peptidase domain
MKLSATGLGQIQGTTFNLILCLFSLLSPHETTAQDFPSRTDILQSTYRIGGGKSNATCVLLSRVHPKTPRQTQYFLVTCAHVLEDMAVDEATLILRKWSLEKNDFERVSHTFKIRKHDQQSLWLKHSDQDLALMELTNLPIETMRTLPFDILATEEDWKNSNVDPGTLVRAIGFPHASILDTSPGAIPLVRTGCLASYPFIPLKQHRKMLVDYNTYEGDSGGPVVLDMGGNNGKSRAKIIGLVQGQHFITEKYDLIYNKGEFNERLGLAIVVNSLSIQELINDFDRSVSEK